MKPSGATGAAPSGQLVALAGLTVGWFATAGLYRDKFVARTAVPTGILVWLCTLVVGMLLRAVTGQGTATAFIVVATLFLGLFLVGWRVIARVWARRRDVATR